MLSVCGECRFCDQRSGPGYRESEEWELLLFVLSMWWLQHWLVKIPMITVKTTCKDNSWLSKFWGKNMFSLELESAPKLLDETGTKRLPKCDYCTYIFLVLHITFHENNTIHTKRIERPNGQQVCLVRFCWCGENSCNIYNKVDHHT